MANIGDIIKAQIEVAIDPNAKAKLQKDLNAMASMASKQAKKGMAGTGDIQAVQIMTTEYRNQFAQIKLNAILKKKTNEDLLADLRKLFRNEEGLTTSASARLAVMNKILSTQKKIVASGGNVSGTNYLTASGGKGYSTSASDLSSSIQLEMSRRSMAASAKIDKENGKIADKREKDAEKAVNARIKKEKDYDNLMQRLTKNRDIQQEKSQERKFQKDYQGLVREEEATKKAQDRKFQRDYRELVKEEAATQRKYTIRKQLETNEEKRWEKNLFNQEQKEIKSEGKRAEVEYKHGEAYQRYSMKQGKLRELQDKKALDTKAKALEKIEDIQRITPKVAANANVQAAMTGVRNAVAGYNPRDIDSVNALAKAQRRLARESKVASKDLASATTSGKGFFAMIKADLGKALQWGISMGIIYGTLRKLREGVAYVMELDNALNEIRIVTYMSQSQVEDLAKGYGELAVQMSVSTAEITKQAAELYRQGLAGKQVEERMKAIIVYAKISGLELGESSKIITATMNATGRSATDVINIFSLLGKFCPVVQ